MQYRIGMFYFTLGNLSPKYRSHLPNIQLVAIAKSAMISSYGMDRILQPFVDDVKKLVCIFIYNKTVFTTYIGKRCGVLY